jgi:hypothetical protein
MHDDAYLSNIKAREHMPCYRENHSRREANAPEFGGMSTEREGVKHASGMQVRRASFSSGSRRDVLCEQALRQHATARVL